MGRARKVTADKPAPSARAKPLRAKLFRTGGSQAVRLPRECRLPGTEVSVSLEGGRVILEPVDKNGWPQSFVEQFVDGPPEPEAFPDRQPQGVAEDRDLEGR